MKKTGTRKTGRLFRLSLFFFLFITLTTQAKTGRITLKMQDAPLEAAMSAIESQTRLLFVNKDVDTDRKISIDVQDATLHEVMQQLFAGTDIGYRIDRKSIYLYINKADREPVSVRGTVRDGAGAPIIGASVVVRGTTVGTSTDAEGTFTLTVPAPASTATLEINFLGYEPVTVVVGNRTLFDITLKEAASEIESVVVTALGIKRSEKALSYNVQQVDAADITNVKDANFINSLSGKVAGVTINASSSGVGGASKVVLRGNKSIAQSSNALYVIDGIPMYNFGGGGGTEFDSRGATEAIADINPEDIESMSVLTGAAAAALYGSEAANGAVMITTKKGVSGALRVTLSSNTKFLNPFIKPRFQNRYGTGSYGLRNGSNSFSWGERLRPAARYNYTPDDFFDTGHVLTNVVTVSGGTDRNQTYFSAGAVNSAGIIPNNEYDRYNFTFRNTSYFLKDRLRLDASVSYIYQKDQNMTNQGIYSNPLVSAYLFPRGEDFTLYKKFERYNPGTKLMEQFWSDDLAGDLRMQNPYWIAYRNLRNTDKKRYMLSMSASYDILPWMSVAGRVRIDNANSLYTQKLYATSNTTITDGGKNGHYTEARKYDSQTYADVLLNINKTFGDDWSLHANIGASINNIKTDELSYRGPIQENGLPNIFNVLPFPRHLTVPTYEYDATNRIWKGKTHYPIGDLKPERTITFEVGIDARFWKHLNFSASWYSADTKNQTFDPALAPSSTYTTIYLQTGHVRNTGVELSLGYSNRWRDFGWSSNFTFSWNRNEIIELAADAVNPVTGEPLNLPALDIKGLGKARYILKKGGTLGDLYTTSDLKFNDNGYIEVDNGGNLQITDDGEEIYLGSVFPNENLAWRNDFRYKGLNLGVLFTARLGGVCYSATQAFMDLYGVSEASAAARDAGGVWINGRERVDAQKWYQAVGSQSGLPQYYLYSATNVRLQELSLGYTFPRRWFRDKLGITVSFVGRNLWKVYCKAPFDPEAVATTGMSYQGIDYFMMPSLRNLGFSVKFEF